MLFKEDAIREGIASEIGGRGLPAIEDASSLRLRIHERLLDILNLSLLDKTPRETLRVEIRGVVAQLLLQEKRLLPIGEKARMAQDCLHGHGGDDQV